MVVVVAISQLVATAISQLAIASHLVIIKKELAVVIWGIINIITDIAQLTVIEVTITTKLKVTKCTILAG